MKRFLLMICAAIVCAIPGSGAPAMPDETLNYVVTYKWGLIRKDAGHATLSLRNRGDDYVMTLTARSKPWADKIYRVRDTLTAVVGRDGFVPRKYVKMAHEDGKIMRDEIIYTGRSAGRTTADASFMRVRKGKTSRSSRSLSAPGEAFDMLSIFYYIRLLDFASMKPGATVTSNVFSGTKSETVKITLVGRDKIKTRRPGAATDAFRLRFSFTTDGRRKSSDDMEAWISTDPSHTVLQIVGKLPVGQVRVVLV